MADWPLTGFVHRAEAHGLNVKSSVRVGDPGDVIAEEARGAMDLLLSLSAAIRNVRSGNTKPGYVTQKAHETCTLPCAGGK